ncbi:hypothetical protein A3A39_04820 [Candidatus Kaiserbacteria bacterium RIFCSPLOWO2_01_FULL_54_13]|uniref:Uncharacterized protein n=1 Tax=Candidatus Kaiserbacteria bacterium RIFCSPLOWO2_01_FULL_54_13 TaxID=1798512 RepID=A0A1F6F0W2_9BACT|nr:MAG: hypothetical protein A3A39_04820 [Candidatus Kaiserbacteria bacterium RIFCSPLOWO2_01_FULL_54_13]
MQESLGKKSSERPSKEESVIGSRLWLQQLNSFAMAFAQPIAMSREQRESFERTVEWVFGPRVIGFSVAQWFSARERRLDYHKAPKEVVEHVRGNHKAEGIVIYVPGMFDTDTFERMKAMFDRVHPNIEDLRKEGWIALDWLYSGRDLDRIHTLQSHLLKLTEKHLARGASVRLLGYSIGGLISKTVADSLSEKYPGHLGLVVHNCPLDPAAGFFVRWANMKRVQDSIAYEPHHAGEYPTVVLGGEKDGIVPHNSILRRRDNQEQIEPKVLKGSRHRDPCSSSEAQDRINAALRLVSIKMPAFARQQVST